MERCDKTIVALRQNRPSVNRSLGVPALQLEQFTVLWILFIVIVAGNVGVLYTLIFGRSRKSRMNYFITHLALADLCVGLISVLTDIIWKITVSWYAGNVACKVIKFSQVVVTYASTYVLVALSIDRYDAIRHPMKFSGSSRIVLRLNGVLWAKFGVATPLFIVNAVCFVRIYLAKWKRAKCLIIAAWIFSVIFSTPILIFYEQKNVHGMVQCWIEFEEKWHWQLYMTLVSVSLFVVPASIIATCYAVIITTIWTKSSRGGFVKTPKHGGRGGGRLGSDNSRRASSRGLIPRAKVKTIKITFVIVSVFIMCWSPYIIFDLLQVYGHVPDTQANIAISTFVQSLAPLNSAANPIIYCLFSTHFCRSLCLLPPFKWLLMRKKRRNVDSANNTQSSSLSEFLTNTHHKRRVVEATSTNNAHTVLMH